MTFALSPPMSPGRTIWQVRLGLIFGWNMGAIAMPAVDREGEDSYSRTEPDTAIDSDVQDVTDARRGDDHAFARLVRRHQGEVARRLGRFSRDPLILQELVQETFVQAFFSLHRYRFDAPLIHWLHRIAVRVGFRHWKRRRSMPKSVAIDAAATAAPAARRHEDAEDLDRVMARLAPRDRLVLVLMYLEDRTVEETARLTGWSRTMVKVQAHRARGRLRKLMRQDGVGGKP